MSEYYAYIVYSNGLYHHGIKGQKWGERRFQNEDGSLTEAGRKRYGIMERLQLGRANKFGKKAYRAEQKYEKARTGWGKRRQAKKALFYRQISGMHKDMAEANGIVDKASAFGGSKRFAGDAAEISKYYKRVANTYKEGSKKNVRNMRESRNYSAKSKAWDKFNKGETNLKGVFSTPIERVRNGKQITYGREVGEKLAKAYATNLVKNIAENAAKQAIKNMVEKELSE